MKVYPAPQNTSPFVTKMERYKRKITENALPFKVRTNPALMRCGVYPALARKGGVYIITPSWVMKKKRDFINGLKNFEKLGFKIINKGFVKKTPSTNEKVKQIHGAFLNKDVELILAQRGGFGSMKLLPYLDFDLIKENPKIFAGFSDISVFLNVIYEKTGLVTLHSPMLTNFSKVSKFTFNSFLNAVNNFPNKNLLDRAPINVYRHGIAKGILKGGNLITLTALIGTDWEIDTDGSILFFEEVEEKLHGIDRCFTQWILNGKFKKIKGLILGNFKGFNPKDVYKILSEQMKIDFPIVHCPYIGHLKNKITLPVGGKVKLNTYKKSLITQKTLSAESAEISAFSAEYRV